MSSNIQPRLQRTQGCGKIAFKCGVALAGEKRPTKLGRLFQQGSARIVLPNTYGNMSEAVLINTAGGLTGGDNLGWSIEAGEGTQSVISTQACEKIYRSNSGKAKIATQIGIAENAELHWLPQESILFDQSALERELHVDMDASSRFLAVEAVILGRTAMREIVSNAHLRDRWRIKRDGKLVHAEELNLSGNIQSHICDAALLNSNKAFATIVYVGPEDEEQMSLMIEGASDGDDMNFGTSIFNGKIIMRIVAKDGYELRQKMIPLIKRLRKDKELPKVWNL